MDIQNHCKNVVERMMRAYKVNTVKALCDTLDVGISVIANRITRDSIPYEHVTRCVLETNVSLKWLMTGDGDMFAGGQTAINTLISRQELANGGLIDKDVLSIDAAFLPLNLQAPKVIMSGSTQYIVDAQFDEIQDGDWLVDIENKISIKQLERIPVNRLRISGGNLTSPFECGIDDVQVIAKVVMVCEVK